MIPPGAAVDTAKKLIACRNCKGMGREAGVVGGYHHCKIKCTWCNGRGVRPNPHYVAPVDNWCDHCGKSHASADLRQRGVDGEFLCAVCFAVPVAS